MPLEVKPATAGDALRAATIEHVAYAPNPLNDVLFPGPFAADAVAERAREMAQVLDHDPTVHWLKVVDTDLEGEASMVAFAQWHVVTAEQRQPPPRTRAFGPGCNPEACELLFGSIARMRARALGDRPHVYLKFLQTDPKHQRRGAGAMLIRWGVEEAKKLGLVAYLESSEEGHELYKRCGFHDMEHVPVDLSKWGATQKSNSWSMMYEP
ncbi:acyl-CoA N-acyltransferase [Xylariomycetidae sp. FL0641]|nr:acyl-CoA N-acyltransferase [Xylariomycetidae sp. FL0641]